MIADADADADLHLRRITARNCLDFRHFSSHDRLLYALYSIWNIGSRVTGYFYDELTHGSRNVYIMSHFLSFPRR
jgi:hypothetical protein